MNTQKIKSALYLALDDCELLNLVSVKSFEMLSERLFAHLSVNTHESTEQSDTPQNSGSYEHPHNENR